MKPGLLATTVFLAILLGGCVGDAKPSSVSSEASGTSTSSSSPATTSAAANASNSAPSVELVASAVNGSAPLIVNFTINATDADGDNLTWTLDADGDGTSDANGTEAAGSYNHTFDTPGIYNATVEVSDGLETANETLSITVVEAAVGALVDVTFTGTLSGIWVGDVVATGQGAYLPPDGGDYHDLEVPTAPKKITITLTWDGSTGYDMDLNVFDPEGTEVADAASFNTPGDSEEVPIVIEDPAVLAKVGTWQLEVLSAGSFECDYTVTVDFE